MVWQVMRMDESKYAWKIHESSMSEGRPMGKLRERWLNELNKAIRTRGQEAKQTKSCMDDSELVKNMQM